MEYYRRMLGGALPLILMLSAALPVPPLCASPAKVREILQASRGEDHPDIDALVQRLEPTDPATIAALRVTLLDRDPYIRATSVRLLGAIGDPSTKSMARLLDDSDEGVRTAAGEALAAVGAPSAGHLNGLLADPETPTAIKQRVAAILGRIGHADSVGPLCEFLNKNRRGGPSHDVALSALGGIGTPSVGPLLGLFRYRSLQRGIYLTFFEFDRKELRSALLGVMNDGEADPAVRVRAAETVEEFLGTRAVQNELSVFYASDTPSSFPAEAREHAKRNAGEFFKITRALQPLTAAGIKRKFDHLDNREAAAEVRERAREAREESARDRERRTYDQSRRRSQGRVSSSHGRSGTSGWSFPRSGLHDDIDSDYWENHTFYPAPVRRPSENKREFRRRERSWEREMDQKHRRR